jgi:hypothetical protein
MTHNSQTNLEAARGETTKVLKVNFIIVVIKIVRNMMVVCIIVYLFIFHSGINLDLI